MGSDSSFCAVILAAGKGTRMASGLPKVMHRVAQRPMIAHVVITASRAGADRIIVVTGPNMEIAEQAASAVYPPCRFAVQPEPLGTGHAVRAAEKEFVNYSQPILILYGDTPLLRPSTLVHMLETLAQEDAAIVVLGMRSEKPNEYGRLILDTRGRLKRIAEWEDATEAERKTPLCNSGVIAVRGNVLPDLLAKLSNQNAKGEYYLTDIVAHACAAGHCCLVIEAAEAELLGVNSRAELAAAEHSMQWRLRERAMKNGATLVAPETVFLAYDTELGRDVTIYPHVVFGAGVRVADEVEIRSFSHLEGAVIAKNTRIGPFARLRPGTEIGKDSYIGNFVEIKNASLATSVRASHLSYIGDASVGEGTNIGAGTITCNYDGFDKYRTEIGAGAFIGSNTALIAPVTVGSGAIIGAGSVITTDVEPDALSFTRAEQTQKPRWAMSFRARKKAKR